VDEEIKYTKKWDIKRYAILSLLSSKDLRLRGLLFSLIIVLVKIAYDAYRNEQQKALYAGLEDEDGQQALWKQCGTDAFDEARRAMYGDDIFRTWLFFLFVYFSEEQCMVMYLLFGFFFLSLF
jgi:hypothetical protein